MVTAMVRSTPGCTTAEVAAHLGLPLGRVAELMYRTGRSEGIGQDLVSMEVRFVRARNVLAFVYTASPSSSPTALVVGP
jgi:hypothetical protein